MSIYWIDADGGSLDLTDGVKYDVLHGVDGRWMPPFDFVTDEHYQVAGDLLRLVKTKEREVTLPIAVYGSSASDFLTNMRLLTDAFNPTLGEGMLKVVTADSKTFLLKCHLGELTTTESTDTGSCTFRIIQATFIAHDPNWFDAYENQRVVVSDTFISAMYVLFNSGDIETWPVWVVSGPASVITIYNHTTGLHISITRTLSSALYMLRIDTRPLTRSIFADNETDEFGHMSIDSTLFPLVPGANQVQVIVTGADSNTYWKCSWADKYNGV